MIQEAVERGGVFIKSSCTNMRELFELIAGDAAEKKLIDSAQPFVEALIERENRISTELEKGIALPHARMGGISEEFIYIVTSEKGIAFGKPGAKIKICFLVGASSDARHYLDVMASIARLLKKKEVVEKLQKATAVDEIFQCIVAQSPVEGIAALAQKDMTGIVLMLNGSQAMDTAMELAVELGIKGVQVVEGTNVAGKIAFSFPFMSLFAANNERITSRMLFGTMEREDIAGRLVSHMKSEGIDIMKPGVGSLMTFPLGKVYGGIDEEVL